MVKTKKKDLAEKSKNKKSNGEQSYLCDLEQVTLKPRLQVHHYLTTWLQIWYHRLLWGDSMRKGADLEKQNCLFGVHPAELVKLYFFYFLLLTNFTNSLEAFPTLVDKKMHYKSCKILEGMHFFQTAMSQN